MSDSSQEQSKALKFYKSYRGEIHTGLSILVGLALASDLRNAIGSLIGRNIASVALGLVLVINVAIAYRSWRAVRKIRASTLEPFRDTRSLHSRALGKARSRYFLLGMSAEELQRSTSSSYFQDRSKSDKRIRELRILLLHPDSPAFFRRIEEVNAPADTHYLVERKKEIIRALRMNLKSLVPDSVDYAQIRFYSDFPVWLIQSYDTGQTGEISEMEVTMHPPGVHGRHSPRYQIGKSAPIFGAFEREFSKRWTSGLPMYGDDFPTLHAKLPIRAIVFDLDGTLIDSDGEKRETVWEIMSNLRQLSRTEFDEVYSRLEGMPRSGILSELRDHFCVGSARLTSVDGLLEQYTIIYGQKQKSIREIDGASETLSRLSDKYSLHIGSSAPVLEVKAAVSSHGWDKYISSSYGFPESKSGAIVAVAESCGISTREILYVGDRLVDEKSALAVGAAFVTLNAATYPASLECKNLRDLPSIVANIEKS